MLFPNLPAHCRILIKSSPYLDGAYWATESDGRRRGLLSWWLIDASDILTLA